MAKKNRLHPVILFGLSAVLLSAGWLMKPFPVLIFVALAPLFAMTDAVRDEDNFWNLSELILSALAIGLLAAHVFSMSFLVISLVQAILMTLAFLGYSFASQRLGNWSGKFMLILFWMTIEYLLIRLPWRDHFVVLADALSLQPHWTNWTRYTGYLGGTAWILLINLFFYLGAFRGKINWYWVVATALTIGGPMGYSLWQGGPSVGRTDMISLYSQKITTLPANYIRLGEVMGSAATIISCLLLAVSFFSTQDRKK